MPVLTHREGKQGRGEHVAGYKELRSAELIALDRLADQVAEMAAEQRTVLKIQGSIITILGQIKEAVTPQESSGDDPFGKLLAELLSTSRAQIAAMARVEAALVKRQP